MLISEAVDLYMADVEISQKSPAHIRKMRWHLDQFATAHGSTEAGEMTRLTLTRWLAGLRKGNGEPYAVASVNGFVAALRGFFGWMAGNGRIAEDISDHLHRKSYHIRQSRVATPEAVAGLREAVIDYAAHRGYRPVDLRDALIVSLSLDSGARRGELHQANVKEIEQALQNSHVTAGGTVYHLESHGKTGQATLRFFDRTAHLARLWLEIRPESASPALFISVRGGQRLHELSITRAFKVLSEWAGVPETLSHAIRHRRITEIMQSSDAAVAAKFANHSDPATTLKFYRHLMDDEVDQVAARTADPLDETIRKLFGM